MNAKNRMSGLQYLKRNTPPTYLMFVDDKNNEPLLAYYHDDLGKLKDNCVFKSAYSIYRHNTTLRTSTSYELCEFETELYDRERYNLIESVGSFYKPPGPYCIVSNKWSNKQMWFPK